MKHVQAATHIAAPAAAVWPLIAEFAQWPGWGPSIRAVEADATHVAPGVRGRVQTPVGVWLPFEITEVEAGRRWTWRVAGLPATDHLLEPIDDASSHVVFSVAWPLAAYRTVLRRGLRLLRAIAEQQTADSHPQRRSPTYSKGNKNTSKTILEHADV